MKSIKKLSLVVICLSMISLALNATTTTLSLEDDGEAKSRASKFSYSAGVFAYKGLDELSETGLGVQLGAGYKINSNFTSSLSTAYVVPEDLRDPEAEKYGWEDLILGFTVPTVAKSDTIDNMSAGVTVTAPTSRASQISELTTAISPSFTLSKANEIRPGKLNISYTFALNLAHYKYDSSAFGTAYSPLGISSGLGFSLVPSDSFSFSAGYSWYNRMDYDKNWDLIQTYKVSGAYHFSPAVVAAISYKWKDKYYSYDSFLDDDKSTISMALSFNF